MKRKMTYRKSNSPTFVEVKINGLTSLKPTCHIFPVSLALRR